MVHMRGEEDRATLVWLRARVLEMVSYLRSRHADDPRTQRLVTKLKGVELLPEEEVRPRRGSDGESSWRNGKFSHTSGVLYVAGRDHRDAPRTRASLLKTVVHELAHATRLRYNAEGSHSQEWKQTWLWMLELATQQLGWDVEVRCAQCTFYGLCERSQCPRCTWVTNLCKPYAGAPR
jgi:hypothetical protein